jgi:hypothetical protein
MPLCHNLWHRASQLLADVSGKPRYAVGCFSNDALCNTSEKYRQGKDRVKSQCKTQEEVIKVTTKCKRDGSEFVLSTKFQDRNPAVPENNFIAHSETTI